jgi:hypothetical protein
VLPQNIRIQKPVAAMSVQIDHDFVIHCIKCSSYERIVMIGELDTQRGNVCGLYPSIVPEGFRSQLG